MRRIVFVAVLALAASCARGGDAGDGGITHPEGPELVVRVAHSGGLLGPSARYREMPAFTLVGDGRVTTSGPQIEIYPPPALPNVVERRVAEAGIQAILRAAADAGLTKGDRSVGLPAGVGVADAGETVFTVVADGRMSTTRVEALGAVDETGERKQVAEFRELLFDLERRLPPGSVSKEEPYGVTALRVVVLPYSASPDPSLKQAARAWPLAQPLSAFGKPTDDAARCGIVEGDELGRLLPSVRESNELTPWHSAGEAYLIAVRPLMPDETTC